jgi:hypothetical protein
MSCYRDTFTCEKVDLIFNCYRLYIIVSLKNFTGDAVSGVELKNKQIILRRESCFV